MIHTIEIENFRGIRTGRLEGLAPLTILTGPNASGKSAVLDALLVGASPDPADAVGRAVARHPGTMTGARWLIWHTAEACRIGIRTGSGQSWERRCTWFGHISERLEERLLRRRGAGPYGMIHLQEDEYADNAASCWTGFAIDNSYETEGASRTNLSTVPAVRVLDPGIAKPLQQAYSEVAKSGRLKIAEEFLKEIVENYERLEILLDEQNSPGLYMKTRASSIPIGLSGDGIQAFVQIALETAMTAEGVALIEEPEVYQHPKALWQTAKVILANVRRGVQVVLTTHSLELIDALISEAEGDDLDRMVTFNLALEDGELQAERWTGDDFAFARREVGTDLR